MCVVLLLLLVVSTTLTMRHRHATQAYRCDEVPSMLKTAKALQDLTAHGHGLFANDVAEVVATCETLAKELDAVREWFTDATRVLQASGTAAEEASVTAEAQGLLVRSETLVVDTAAVASVLDRVCAAAAAPEGGEENGEEKQG